MKYASKKFFAAVLACAAAWMAGAPEAAFARAEYDGPMYDVTATLVNKTNATIYVALAMRWRGGGDGRGKWDTLEGWFSVEPGKKSTAVFMRRFYHELDWFVYGFYATSPAAGRVWAGERKKEMDGWNECWVRPEKNLKIRTDGWICWIHPVDCQAKCNRRRSHWVKGSRGAFLDGR